MEAAARAAARAAFRAAASGIRRFPSDSAAPLTVPFAAFRAAASGIRRFPSDSAAPLTVPFSAFRAAVSGFRRFSSDSAAPLTAPFTAAYGSDAQPSRVSDLAMSSLGIGAVASQIERSRLINESQNFVSASTLSCKHQVNPRSSEASMCRRRHFSTLRDDESAASTLFNPSYSRFPMVDASLARSSSDASTCGWRHFSTLQDADSAASQVLRPNEHVIEYKQKVINPTYHEAKYFAQNVMDPMMTFPNDKVRLLADTEAFYTPAERGKPLFNSMKQILVEVHLSGQAFANPVKISDFLVTESYYEYRMEGKKLVKELTYKFVIKDGTQMCNYSHRKVRENYCDASDALREFIGFTCDLEKAPLAPDLESSLGCMKLSSFPKGYLTYVDPVFMRLEDRSEAFLDIYDELESNDDLQAANVSGAARNCLPELPWEATVGSHELLKRWYDFKEEGHYNRGSWSLLGYLRNVNRHPVLYFDTRFGEYTKAELQRLLQFVFPSVLPRLYRNIYRQGLLKSLGAHRFFRLH